jgi:hypothetical protein
LSVYFDLSPPGMAQLPELAITKHGRATGVPACRCEVAPHLSDKL